MAIEKRKTKSVQLTPSLVKKIERWSVPVEAHAGKIGLDLSFSDKLSILVELGLARKAVLGVANEMHQKLYDLDPEESDLVEWGRVLSPRTSALSIIRYPR